MKWDQLKEKAKLTAEKAKHLSEHAVASMGVLANETSEAMAQTDWFRGLNKYTSEISKSMDENWIAYTREKIGDVMSARNHRILDGGHDFFSTISKAQEIGDKNGWDSLTTFQEWAKSYFSDLSSSSGMPMFGKLSDEIYLMLKSMGVKDAVARDFVTVNGQEALEAVMGGAIAGMALVFSWKKEDKEAFSKSVAIVICSGTLTLNPAALMVGIIALAFGYNKLVCKEAMARGAISSSVGMAVSLIIPGPVLLGLIPAIVASVYLSKKMGTEFKPIDLSKKMFLLVRSPAFQQTCVEIFEELKGKVKTGASESTEVA
jgi:hypothetical protein